jgi:ketosteroid isomerase-like protein
MSDAERNLEILKQHLAAENAHDAAGTLATLHPDCLFEDRMTGEIYRGHEGAGAYYDKWWRALDLTVLSERRHMIDDGNIVSEAHYQGVHRDSLFGELPTGTTIDFPIATLLTFRDGLLAGERFYYDLGGLVARLRGTEEAI